MTTSFSTALGDASRIKTSSIVFGISNQMTIWAYHKTFLLGEGIYISLTAIKNLIPALVMFNITFPFTATKRKHIAPFGTFVEFHRGKSTSAKKG
jgi:hypothetical protein